jgi:hypothetical protein
VTPGNASESTAQPSSSGAKTKRWLHAIGLTVMPVFVLLFFYGCMNADSKVTGWRAMASRYAAGGETEADRVERQDGTVGEWGFVHTKGLLRVGDGEQGLFIANPGWLSAAHPPLRIPWSDLRVKDADDVLGTHIVRLAVGEPEIAVIILRGGKARAIEERLKQGSR